MENKKKTKFIEKYGLRLVVILLMVAPICINLGLVVTDYIYQKTGATLTAIGLDNKNWLEFWKDYLSITIAFLGIFLVWDSSNKDRKKQYNKDLSEQYLQGVCQEEKVLVEVSQCFNTGIIYKSLKMLGSATASDSSSILQDARDKIDEAHVKFELLTELSNDFKKCESCIYDPCIDKEIMQEIRDVFYDMEGHYINMLNLGEEYCNNFSGRQHNLEMINIHVQLINNIKQQISWLQNSGDKSDEVYSLQKQLAEEEKQLKKLNEGKINTDELNIMLKPIIEEINYITKTMRPKFNKYCKVYIDIKKKHVMELQMNGKINYIKKYSTVEEDNK